MKTHAKTVETSATAKAGAPALAAVAVNSATPETPIASASTTSFRSWRDGLEVVGFWALTLVYIWRIEFRGSVALDVICVLLLGAIPILSLWQRRETPRDIGLRLDNLTHSAREVGIATIVAATLIVACGIAAGGALHPSMDLIPIGLGYAVWGLLQQLALQGFVQRRLSAVFRDERITALASAMLFASLHLPNPVLVPATLVTGYVWCRLYRRAPNLITLACSHAALAVAAMATFPPAWIHDLRIGPGYWLYG